MTKAGFLEEGSVEMRWIEGRREESGCGLRGGKMAWVSGDKGVSAGEEDGAEPLRCQFSPRMESLGGAGGGGRFLLRWLFWGLNRIKSAAAPRAPNSCVEQLSRRGR